MPSPERFVTLFDYNFLPQGLALAESLAAVCPDAELWVLCMDEALERALARLAPPGLRPIPLREVEDSRLLAAKADRSAREYCWTATAFTFDAVFERCPDARRVTYLDADLFFFDSPRPIFGEFERSGAAVLVTEHGYDPVYDLSGIVGRFCVQFLTMDRSARARPRRGAGGRIGCSNGATTAASRAVSATRNTWIPGLSFSATPSTSCRAASSPWRPGTRGWRARGREGIRAPSSTTSTLSASSRRAAPAPWREATPSPGQCGGCTASTSKPWAAPRRP